MPDCFQVDALDIIIGIILGRLLTGVIEGLWAGFRKPKPVDLYLSPPMPHPGTPDPTSLVAFSQLDRCQWCGAHLIGTYDPVNISTVTDREQVFVRGYEHVCRGDA